MILKDSDSPVNLWYMGKAFSFDYSAESVWCLKGLHWIVRGIFVVSSWIPRAVFIAATTDVTRKGLVRNQ